MNKYTSRDHPATWSSLITYLEALPVKIVLPSVLTVMLFITTIFMLILPILESNMMELKRQMIQELTETAWSAVADFERREASGLLPREEAQKQAREHIRQLRYGPEQKDYFWINDMHPRLIMHPYRRDLEGQDISDLADPNGKRLFVEFVNTVKASGSGYVDYEWQWMNETGRIVPKISFVKGFEPWGWIIGTGIYIEDVRTEIASITQKLTWVCLGILVLILTLSAYIIWQGIESEKERRQAARQAMLHQEQLFQASKMASLGTLVSGVAHEINNPIMSVMLNAPILRETWKTVLPILDDYCNENGEFYIHNMSYALLRDRIPMLLNSVEESAKRVKNIVSDLKDFARHDTSNMCDTVDINRIVEKSVVLVDNMIKKSTTRFSTDYTSNPPHFKGNAQRIEQVIINLLVNSCQALPDKSKALAVSTGYDEKAGQVFVVVRDEGVGMSEEVLRQIKDPFFTTKRESGGTGLGLSISDRIIEDHGGTLSIVSGHGKGTTVRVSIPVT